MKFLFDLFPVILFFGVFKWGKSNVEAAHAIAGQYLGVLVSGGVVQAAQAPILLATTVVIAATFLQIAYLLVRRKKIDNMLWISLAIVTVFGGATIYFHNEIFIMWKPTVLYWCFAVGLLISHYLFNKNLAQKMMGQHFDLSDVLWARLNLSWVAFFAALGVINLLVAYNYSESAWVNFKLFGATGLLFAFFITQAMVLSKYMKESG